MLRVMEAAGEGGKVGDRKVSGLLFADNFVGMPDAPEALQRNIDAAMTFVQNWRLLPNVKKKCTAKHGIEPADFSWKRGNEELPTVDQYIYLPWGGVLGGLFMGRAHHVETSGARWLADGDKHSLTRRKSPPPRKQRKTQRQDCIRY